MIDQLLLLRSAMAKLVAAAVSIITTDGLAGRHGLVASAVTSISGDPLLYYDRQFGVHASLTA